MIDAILQFNSEIILIRVDGNTVRFANSIFGAQMADIRGLKLDYGGVCRQFPDLQMKDDWKEQAILRFKNKIQSFKTEQQKLDYLVEDLASHGYKLIKVQKKGWRPRKVGK